MNGIECYCPIPIHRGKLSRFSLRNSRNAQLEIKEVREEYVECFVGDISQLSSIPKVVMVLIRETKRESIGK